MSIALVNQTVGSGVSAANQNITAAATIGNFLAMFYARSGGLATGAVTSVTDTGGNTWVSIPCRGAVSGGTNTRIEFWYCQVSASPGTITVNSGTAQTNSWNISEWSGIDPTTPIDASSPDNSGNAASTTQTTPTIAPALTTDLILAAAHFGQTTTSGLTAAFTALTNFDDAAVGSGRAAYLIDTGAGPYAASWTLGASKSAGVITVAIKAAVSGTLFTKSLTGSLSFSGSLATLYTPAVPPPPPVSTGPLSATPIKGSVLRLVNVDATGTSLGTLTLVTKSFTQVQMQPSYQDGDEFFERSADGQIIVNRKTPPILVRLQLQVDICSMNPDGAATMFSARELTTGPPVSGMGFALMEGPSPSHFSLEVWQRVGGRNACDPSGAQRYIYNAWPHCYNTHVGNYQIGNQRSILSFVCDTSSVLDDQGPWTAYLPAGVAGQAQDPDRWLWNITTVAPPATT